MANSGDYLDDDGFVELVKQLEDNEADKPVESV